MSVLDKLAATTTKTETSAGKTGGPHARFEDVEGRDSRPVAPVGKPLLAAKKLFKSYRKGKVEVPVLRGVDFQIHPGRFTAVVGQSGCGKSTLLHLLATLDAPDSGSIHFEGRRIDNLPASAKDAIRNRQVGMIFQFYHLL